MRFPLIKNRMDVESLQPSARPRVRCLDVFLVMSVVLLSVVLAAVTAGGVMVVMELRSEVDHGRPSLAGQVGDDPGYKMQNFAYLEPTRCRLNNGTMTWAPVDWLTADSVGRMFSFDRSHHALQTKQDGSYFIYLDLNLTCTSVHCSAGLLTVRLEDQQRKGRLTCIVELPQGAVSTPVSKKCWTVARLPGGTQLVAQMIVPQHKLKNWKLELNTGLGMFLVA